MINNCMCDVPLHIWCSVTQVVIYAKLLSLN